MNLLVRDLTESLLVLSGSLALLAALNAGADIMLSLADLSHNAGLGAAALKSLKSTLQRFVFLYMDFRHLFFPPSITPSKAHSGQWVSFPFIDYTRIECSCQP